MEIKTTYKNSFGQVLDVFYKDIENENDFKGKHISGAHMFCFCKDKLVIVYAESKGYWGPPGGGVEKGEKITDTVIREIKEETNMKVLKQKFIGYREIFEPKRIVSQVRVVCIVEPYGDFVHDPDGEVTEIKLIDPKDVKQYFDWGDVGDRLMKRALEAKMQMELELSHMNRIAVVGISGSGKSTLANKLGKKLDLPVFHLDKYFWDVGWKKRYTTKTEFTAVVDEFAKQDKWIIDGNYRSSNIDFRFERADTIIFLDFPKYRCLWRVFIRVFDRKQPFDKTEGVKQKIDWGLIKWILGYKINEMRERVMKHKDNKKIFVVHNNKEIYDFTKSL